MSTLAERMKIVWENTWSRNAHLGINGEEQDMMKRYENLITSRIKVEGKTIIDFGCGGGLLGKYLLNNFKIKKYIAYDIAERSINKAKESTAGHDNVELNLLSRHVWNFAEKKPDILIALAVMIHMPTQDYLNNFLTTVNESGAKKLVLEIRDTGAGTLFQSAPYGTIKRTLLACITNEAYISERLTGYKLLEKTDPKIAPTNCQILWYEKIKATK